LTGNKSHDNVTCDLSMSFSLYYEQLYIIKIDNVIRDRSIGFSGYYKQLYIIKIDNVTCDRSMGFSVYVTSHIVNLYYIQLYIVHRETH
jgi:hypothetical protein